MNDILQILMRFFEKASSENLLHRDKQFLMTELVQLGVPHDGIDEILSCIKALTPAQSESTVTDYPLQPSTGTRVFSPYECVRISKKSRALLLNLENMGILKPTMREMVLDELMCCDLPTISFTRVKWTTLMVLTGQSENLSSTGMTQFLWQETAKQLH